MSKDICILRNLGKVANELHHIYVDPDSATQWVHARDPVPRALANIVNDFVEHVFCLDTMWRQA